MLQRVLFGSYAPDLPPFGNPGSTALKNVIPHANGFRPLPSFNVYSSNALDARCQGAVFVKDDSGNVSGFAGDAAKLYRLSGGSTAWDDVSKVGGYSTAGSDLWSFAQFGERVIATNLSDAVQSFVLGSSTDFADLGGGAPQAKYAAVIANFLVLAHLSSDGTALQWSAIGDPTSFPTPGTDSAITVQADSQSLSGNGGGIQGIAGGLAASDGAVIQERALWRMAYVQPPLVFAFRQVEDARGTPAPGSLVQVGGRLFYLGEDGFYAFDGQSSRPIGGSRVDRTFFEEADTSFYSRISAAADPVNKLVVWAYPGTGNTGGAPNKLLIYNWETNEWSPGEVETEALVRAATFGVDLDTDLSADETLLDDENWPSLDSRFWVGGRPGLAAIDSDHKLAFFAGAPLGAELATGEFTADEIALITRVRPLVETGGASPTITAAVASRYLLTDAPTYKQSYPPTSAGHCFARSRGRYHRVKLNISGDDVWGFAQGVEIEGPKVGGR